LAVTTWNAVVRDTWEPGPARVDAVRAAVQALPSDARGDMLPFFEALMERKRRDFPEDPRLLGGLKLRWGEDFEPHLRVESCLPGRLQEEPEEGTQTWARCLAGLREVAPS
jgi:hypothetical protein